MVIGRASKNICEAVHVKESRGVTSQVTVNTSTHLVRSVLPLWGLQSLLFFDVFLTRLRAGCDAVYGWINTKLPVLLHGLQVNHSGILAGFTCMGEP